MSDDYQAPDEKDLPDSEQSDEDIIADAKAYLELCDGANTENYREALEDLRILSGDHWPEESKRQRKLDGRPIMTINKLPNMLGLVTNSNKMNRMSIKVSPVGSGADIDTAEVLQGIIKHIEYESSADIATDTAVSGAAAVGWGYYRILPEYCSDKSFDQKLAYKRIANGFSVAFDPSSTMPDGSDQMRCLIHSKEPRKQFKLQYPDAKTDQPLDTSVSSVVNWDTQDYVRVGEFYRIEKTPAELVLMSDGGIFFRDEMPPAVALAANNIREVKTRQSWKTKVMWYKLTAHEILDRTEIKCKWIPVFPVFGTELNIDGRVIRKGIIRDARDPQIMYDYWMTAATEEVAMRNKTPYIGVEGQFNGHKTNWLQANNRSFPYLEYRAVSIDGQLAPPPQRQSMTDIPNGMLTMALHANDNIKATTGLFDASLGNAGNATSGVQEHAQQNQGGLTNSHYQDGLKRTQRHAGRCLIDMIPNYYDTPRVVQIMREDDTITPVPINHPLTPEEAQQLQAQKAMKAPQGAPSPAIQKVLNDVTTGEYAVVVDSGPAYSTVRKEAADAMVQFGQSWPKLMDIAGDKVVKAMDWPGAEGIAERIARTIPPNIMYDPKDPNSGPPPIPPEAQQQMQAMQQQLAELHEENQRLKSGVDKEMMRSQTQQTIADMRRTADIQIAEINGEAKRLAAELAGVSQILAAIKREPTPALSKGADQATIEPVDGQ